MKKIILFSCLFSLITISANATYYQTTTEYCGDANMLAELDRATALHRAVITEIDCDYVKPVAPKKHATPKPVPKRIPTYSFQKSHNLFHYWTL